MPSTYSSNLKLELMATGENSGTWGNITNTNLGTAAEQAIVGLGNVDYVSDANLTISITNSNAAQAARALVLNVTSSLSLTATRELVVPTIEKQYIVQNNTTGSQSITVKTSAGTGITVPNGRKAHLYVNGTNVIQMFDFVDINGGTIDGTPIGGSSTSTGAFTTLSASGAATFNGAVTLGDAAADNITFNGTITSHLLFTDNTYDIGASGATRPRNLFLAGAATIGGNLSVGGTLTLTGGLILNGNVTVGDSSADTLTVNATITSNLLFTDNTYDIGASGATRPRNLFLAGNATIGGNTTMTGSLTVDSTTDSSSTTTGSIQTDGGLGVAKALFVGLDANIYGITVGRGAGAVSTNTAVGASALAVNTTGALNVAVGTQALTTNTDGVRNVAVGRQAMYLNTTGGYNVSVGMNSMEQNTTASYNTALGYASMQGNTTGELNTAVGVSSLNANTTGSRNVAVGNDAVTTATTATDNVGLGSYALRLTTTGSYNTGVGSYALYSNTTASNNTAVGYQAGYSNTTGSTLAFFGYQAGYSGTTAIENTGLGYRALTNATTGNYNTAVGTNAGAAITTGAANIAVGRSALQTATTPSDNTAVGYRSMISTTTGGANTALGSESLQANTTGANNIAIGVSALASNTTASSNTAVGYQAGYSNTTSGGAVFLGFQAGYGSVGISTTINYNTAIGYQAGYALTSGYGNTLVGNSSGNAITTGYKNTILGTYSGNQGGLDIRTASNYIVLSDGDGNPREYITNTGTAVFTVDRTSSTNATSITLRDNVTGAQTNGVYKSIRSESNAGVSVAEIRFIETDGTNNNTAIAFATANTSGGISEKARVLNTGAILAFSGANTTANGTGVGFPSTQSASTDPNVLDDYEEGTWTASLGFRVSSTGSLAYSSQEGRYIKIGNMVFVSVFLVWTANNFSASSGTMQLQGLPFASAATNSYRGGLNITYSGAPWTGVTIYQQAFRSEPGETNAVFNFSNATDGNMAGTITSHTSITNGGASIMITGCYTVA